VAFRHLTPLHISSEPQVGPGGLTAVIINYITYFPHSPFHVRALLSRHRTMATPSARLVPSAVPNINSTQRP